MASALQRRANLGELAAGPSAQQGPSRCACRQAPAGGGHCGRTLACRRLLIELLNDDGISGWIANHPVGGYVVDIAFPGLRIAIEVDGWAFHSDRQVFQSDRVRQNQIALLGWQVLRFTWFDLTERPQRVLAQIRRAICAA